MEFLKNIQHRTPNIQHPTADWLAPCSMFGVGCWRLDVGSRRRKEADFGAKNTGLSGRQASASLPPPSAVLLRRTGRRLRRLRGFLNPRGGRENPGSSQGLCGTPNAPLRIAFVTIGPEKSDEPHDTAAQCLTGLRRFRCPRSLSHARDSFLPA